MGPFDGEVPGLVRRVRRILDVSQRGLAALLGVSQSQVARWETRRTSPRASVLVEMLRLARLRVRLHDAETGKEVEPMRDDGARDRARRRYPAHVDLRVTGWWMPRDAMMTAQDLRWQARSQAVAGAVRALPPQPLAAHLPPRARHAGRPPGPAPAGRRGLPPRRAAGGASPTGHGGPPTAAEARPCARPAVRVTARTAHATGAWSDARSPQTLAFSAPIVVSGPWPGVHDRLVGEVEEPRADRLLDQVGVAVGATGRPRTALEEGVAGEDAAEVVDVEAHRARRVPGRVDHRHRGTADGEGSGRR